ncbi:Ger(x)C family spore germination protein [Clostridium bowmanii]|uniref:Ger(x)C family spore germination protein n=1 Tax=Clostridium bowmanii TaxID=132925 RepID=UPI001C0C9615|nr:Ger(x)C family spore germination protein [Clostridium bowmanii]MBU3189316.1 Ger(x)C family spore germination protein [Clostridium bowmanii]MCA1073933.1 Ger(x)C family spore germination protein [Clostridium bowmanii]
MKRYKKILIIGLIIMNCFSMSSCFSYRDINKVLFITGVIVDVDNIGNPIIYGEAFKGIRGVAPQGMDERILFKGTGKTMFEAIRNMNSTSSYKLNYTQNKAIIFTQKAAELGLDNFIDLLDRDQELLIRPYIAVYKGDPEKLIKLNIAQDKYIGLFLVQLIENIGASSRAVKLDLNQFYNQRNMGDKTNVVTIIDITKDTIEPTLEVNGGAVIKDDKMVSILSSDEGQGFNFLMNTILGGTLEITNPCDINKFVTLEIKKSKTNTEISYYDNIVHLKKKIVVKVDFGEAQKSIILTNENISKIQETSEKNIVKACNNVFQKYKGMGIDIFDISQEFYTKYPKIKIENVINKTDIEVEAEVQIMNIGDVKNFN